MTAKTRRDDWHFKLAVDKAVATTEEEGQHVPLFIGYSSKHMYYLPMIHKDDAEKQLIFMAMKLFCACFAIEHYIIINEVWAVNTAKEDIDCRPSEHPERVSALIVASVNYERIRGECFVITPVKPEEGSSAKAALKKSHSPGMNFSGHLFEFLTPQESNLHGHNISQEHRAAAFRKALAMLGMKAEALDFSKEDLADFLEQ